MADEPVHEACKRECALRGVPGQSLVDTFLTCTDACDLLVIEKADAETLWSVAVPKADGSGEERFVPALSRDHAEGMARRWRGPARATEWPFSPSLHAGMTRGMVRLFGEKPS